MAANRQDGGLVGILKNMVDPTNIINPMGAISQNITEKARNADWRTYALLAGAGIAAWKYRKNIKEYGSRFDELMQYWNMRDGDFRQSDADEIMMIMGYGIPANELNTPESEEIRKDVMRTKTYRYLFRALSVLGNFDQYLSPIALTAYNLLGGGRPVPRDTTPGG